MKIAYLLLCHKDPDQIKRLCNRLVKTGDVFINVDKKSDGLPFERALKGMDGVILLKKRVNVSYAGWSMVKGYMALLEKAYTSDKNYDRFVLMTGQDYPLMTDENIIKTFDENRTVEYVMAYNIVTSTIDTDKNKIQKLWFMEFPFRNKFLRRCYLSFMYRFVTKPFKFRGIQVPLLGKKVDPYFGQMLSAFTRAGAKLILEVYKNDKKFNRVMKHVYPAVEIYWQTIIFNSNLRKNTVQGGKEHEITEHFGWAPLHYHHYLVDTSIFDEKDFDEISNSGYMFFRKVVAGVSDKLMDMVDEIRE